MQDKEASNTPVSKAAHFLHCASQGPLMTKGKHKPCRVVLNREGHQVVKFCSWNSHFSLFCTAYYIFKCRSEEFFDTNELLGIFFLKKNTYNLCTENHSRKYNIKAAQSVNTLVRVKPRKKKLFRCSFMSCTCQSFHIRFHGFMLIFSYRRYFLLSQ